MIKKRKGFVKRERKREGKETKEEKMGREEKRKGELEKNIQRSERKRKKSRIGREIIQ